MSARFKNEEKCWFKTCVNKALVTIRIRDVEHKVCYRHGQQYGSSLEYGPQRS